MLEVKFIEKSYGEKKIIEDVSLTVKKGEMVALLGVSGIGKSTLFNIVAGLEQPDKGQVYLNGECVTGIGGKVGYMQQSDLLLPFKTVIKNVMIPLKLKKVDRDEAYKMAEEILKEFELIKYKDMYPCQLSGGMRQRVSLARTFMTRCNVMLLDEPFSALDAITRGQMQKWFKETVKRHNIATLLITHDVEEAMALSDRIYVMSGSVGKISKEFKKEEINKEKLLDAVKG